MFYNKIKLKFCFCTQDLTDIQKWGFLAKMAEKKNHANSTAFATSALKKHILNE